MRTFIKLALAALALYVGWRVGTAYWSSYRFQDAVQEAAQFAFRQSESELQDRVLSIASEMRIPVQREDISVRKTLTEVFIDVPYTDRIQILPRYTYPWRFTVKVHAWLRP